MTEDIDIAKRISALTSEEHELEQAHAGTPATEEQLARMKQIDIELDQCWDLLRQRRARRHGEQNPEEAEVRPASTVENYQQ